MRSRTTAQETGRRWHHWTEREAREALAEFGARGESVASFARRTGISRQRIAYWRKRVSRPETTDFVAVALPEGPTSRWIEIAAAGVVVRLREELDVDHVARLVEAIGRRVAC